MERVGEKLRRRREELGFTIDDIARATNYRPDVIQAIEEGRKGVFPAEAYRQALLRAYADKLGLDPAEVVREQKSEEERVQEALKGIRLKPRTGPGRRRTVVWLVVIVVVAVALLTVYDRVIKVRGLREPAEEAGGPRVGAAESTHAGGPDSQAVAVPSDSAGVDSGVGESREGQDEAPGDRGESEETGSSEGQTAGETGAGPVTVDSVEEVETVADDVAVGSDERTEEPGVVDNVAVESDEQGEEARLTDAQGTEPGGPAGRDWLAVSVGGYAVRARLRAGDSILVDRWLRSGFRDTFYSNQPFWADTIITNDNSMLLVLNGERVDLPNARDNVITDFRISP